MKCKNSFCFFVVEKFANSFIHSFNNSESVETLLREHAFRHSPFRAFFGSDLSPHDQQALANAAGMFIH